MGSFVAGLETLNASSFRPSPKGESRNLGLDSRSPIKAFGDKLRGNDDLRVKFLAFDLEDLELFFAGGEIDGDGLARLVPEETFTERRMDGELAVSGIGFFLAHEGVGKLVVR